MEFNLFAALKILNLEFGEECNIIFRNSDMQYEIFIQVIPNNELLPLALRKNKEMYSYRFTIEEYQVTGENCSYILRRQFREAIEQIKRYIKEDKHDWRT